MIKLEDLVDWQGKYYSIQAQPIFDFSIHKWLMGCFYEIYKVIFFDVGY
jgi:hypothetical protein